MPDLSAMTATTGQLPLDDDRWAFEPKWDGMRALVFLHDGRVRIKARSGRDVTPSFPEVAELGSIGVDAVIDGEIVAVDAEGRTSFGLLQRRFGVTAPRAVAAAADAVPVTYVAFDLLHLDGNDCWRLPFLRRRRLLESLAEATGGALRLTPSSVGGGEAWLDAAREQSIEGLVAKRVDAPYEPGRRSTAWRKIKLRHSQELLVCGWTPGAGRREGRMGSLVLGCHAGDGLRWMGNVGTGLTDAGLDWWRNEVESTATDECPFADLPRHPALRAVRWVVPRRIVQVAFSEITGEGRLRQPSLLGLRDDVDPSSVRCQE